MEAIKTPARTKRANKINPPITEMATITPIEILSLSSPPPKEAAFEPGTGRVGVGVSEGVCVPEDVRVGETEAEKVVDANGLASTVGCGVLEGDDKEEEEGLMEGVADGSGSLLPGLGRVGVRVLDGVRV